MILLNEFEFWFLIILILWQIIFDLRPSPGLQGMCVSVDTVRGARVGLRACPHAHMCLWPLTSDLWRLPAALSAPCAGVFLCSCGAACRKVQCPRPRARLVAHGAPWRRVCQGPLPRGQPDAHPPLAQVLRSGGHALSGQQLQDLRRAC